MNKRIFCAGCTPANHYAQEFLQKMGFSIVYCPEDAHAVLMDVPTKPESVEKLLPSINSGQLVIGGNLDPEVLKDLPFLDLLQDEFYLAKNAAITAHCALRLAMTALPVVLPQATTVILGWGRIGKVLANLLKDMNVPLTVTARSCKDLAALSSMGYQCCRAEDIELKNVRLIINTVPKILLNKNALEICPHAVKLDLASKKGLAAPDTLWARGLPGIHAPESSGCLIAESIDRFYKEGHV